MFFIDTVSFNKAAIYENDHGYSVRPASMSRYRSSLIHTTNGKKGTSLYAEARYIFSSPDISAHFLIGKDGQIIQFLNPAKFIAWHAGRVRATVYSNPYSIGIEMHNTPVEGHITTQQFSALDWLVRQLMKDYGIAARYVETHRYAAVPAGRKIDPSGFPDAEFYAWRDTLVQPIPIDRTYRVINPRGIFVRQSPQVNDHNIAGILHYNDTFIGGDIKNDENNEYIKGTNKWIHLKHGMSQNKDISGLGFVHMSNIKPI